MSIRTFLRRFANPGGEQSNQIQSSAAKDVSEAVREAQLLLHFASSRGIRIEESIVKNTVEAADLYVAKVRSIKATRQIEQEFWMSYRELASAVKPVSVESIKATRDIVPRSRNWFWFLIGDRSLSQLTVVKYTFLAVLTLLFVIAIQMYWMVGISITSEAVSLAGEIRELAEQKQARETEVGEENLVTDVLYNSIDSDIIQHQEWLAATHENLRSWNRLWQKFSASFFKLFPSSIDTVEESNGNPLNDPEVTTGNVRKERIAITSAGFVLRSLSTYVVPLLYGLLGAFAYVLRELAREVRTVVFSETSSIGYHLRLCLGLLAGIAVGFLVSPEADEGAIQETQRIMSLTTLGPSALAFVAGYGVELVFAALDRIVSAFVNN